MLRTTLALVLLAGLAAAQSGDAAGQPQSDFGTRIDTIRQVPFFRPKVVVRQDVVVPKDPFLGGALSLILPGTGQAYCNKWLKGVGFLAGAVGSYAVAARLDSAGRKPIAGVFALVGIGFHVWSVIDGVRTADAYNRELLKSP